MLQPPPRANELYLRLGPYARQQFDFLCEAGCDRQVLSSFLFFAAHHAYRGEQNVYELYGVPQSKIKKLPGEISRAAQTIEAIWPTFEIRLLSELTSAGLLLGTSQRAELTRDFCRRLPTMLRALSDDLKVAVDRGHKFIGPKRINAFRLCVLDLLKYVDSRAKRPHYEEIANIFIDFLPAKRKIYEKVVPSLGMSARPHSREMFREKAEKLLTSADALRTFYRRAKRYQFR